MEDETIKAKIRNRLTPFKNLLKILEHKKKGKSTTTNIFLEMLEEQEIKTCQKALPEIIDLIDKISD